MNALRTATVVAALLVCAAVAATVLKPHPQAVANAPKVHLADEIPEKFADWHEDSSGGVVLPDPNLVEQLHATYSDTLSRTYIDGAKHRVMLSIAYGADQSNEATQAHRPEYCYTSQGFQLTELPASDLDLGADRIAVRRIIAARGERYEPITYWLTIGGQPTLPGFNRKWLQFQYRLRGHIPDGVIFRVSTVGLGEEESYAVQRSFLKALFDNLSPPVRGRYFGA
jgi:EpsI family protein